MAQLYPSESNHLESIQALQEPNVHFIGVEIERNLLACGATKILNDDGQYAEVKRVFVAEQARGRGLSKIIMAALEDHLRTIGIRIARLETGIKQPEAIGLYRKLGYTVRGPFGNYQPDPLSIFMEKYLEA